MEYFKNCKSKFSEIHSNLFADSILNSNEKFKYLRSELESLYEKSSFLCDKSPTWRKNLYQNLKTLLAEIIYMNSRVQQTEALSKVSSWYLSKIPNRPKDLQSSKLNKNDLCSNCLVIPQETHSVTPNPVNSSFESMNKKFISMKQSQIESFSKVKQRKSFFRDWATL